MLRSPASGKKKLLPPAHHTEGGRALPGLFSEEKHTAFRMRLCLFPNLLRGHFLPQRGGRKGGGKVAPKQVGDKLGTSWGQVGERGWGQVGEEVRGWSLTKDAIP